MNAGELSIYTNSTYDNAAVNLGADGAGTFHHNVGTVHLFGSLKLATNTGRGIYNLSGGELNMHQRDIVCGMGDAQFNFTGGTLKNVGDFYGDLDQQGGTLIVGGSIGLMYINGNYELDSDAILEIELAGDGHVPWQDHAPATSTAPPRWKVCCASRPRPASRLTAATTSMCCTRPASTSPA